jgi:hypothetical protein
VAPSSAGTLGEKGHQPVADLGRGDATEDPGVDRVGGIADDEDAVLGRLAASREAGEAQSFRKDRPGEKLVVELEALLGRAGDRTDRSDPLRERDGTSGAGPGSDEASCQEELAYGGRRAEGEDVPSPVRSFSGEGKIETSGEAGRQGKAAIGDPEEDQAAERWTDPASERGRLSLANDGALAVHR